MANNGIFWRWFIRRPFKLVANFLKWQVVTSLLAALIIGIFCPPEPIMQISQEAMKNINKKVDGEILFLKDELALFNGENGQPIYLALLGSVFDVSKGHKHYGPGCAYNFFVGRDASVSFISGEFENFNPDQADDVLQHVKGKDLLGLANWKNFYHKDYVYKGKLVGRFYNERGELTQYHHKYLAALKQAEKLQENIEQLSVQFPECNIEWSEQKGSHVWCTNTSGGKERQWIGYPRKLYQVGKEDFRCACVRAEDLKTNVVMLKEYENCDSNAHSCYFKVD